MAADFASGMKYPWQKPGRLWNALWILVPIIGWFALLGYMVRIVQALNKGKNKEIPPMDKFWEKFKLGFLMFVKMIPFYIVVMVISFVLGIIPIVGTIAFYLLNYTIITYLYMHFMVTEKFESLWDVKRAASVVFGNFKDYVIAFLKTVGYTLIYAVASIVLVGIPCNMFGSMYFMVDFYRTAK